MGNFFHTTMFYLNFVIIFFTIDKQTCCYSSLMEHQNVKKEMFLCARKSINIMHMTIRICLFTLAAAVVLGGCGDKKKEEKDPVVTVKTLKVAESSSSFGNSYGGTIEGTHAVMLSFSAAGTIKSLNLSEGQSVRQGQTLGLVDATSSANAVTAAHATTRQAQDALAQAEDAYRRMKKLHDSGSLPDIRWVDTQTKLSQAQSAVRQARAAESIARKGLSDTRLTAPFSGYVSRKIAEVGQNVMPGTPVAQLVKIDQVKVKISIPETDIDKVHVGQTVVFKVSSLDGSNFTGRVIEKGVDADPVARTYNVTALVDNRGHRLLPGMVCDVTLSQGESTEITLPANLIQLGDDNQPFVWTVVGGKAHRQNVVLGANVGDNVVIRKGIDQSSEVICSGQQKVSEGMKVKK
jgi:membrane fusion protein (multidrug efflux system)